MCGFAEQRQHPTPGPAPWPTIVGNITRLDLRYSANGTAVASFGIASNRRYRKDDEWQEATSFFDCVAFNDLADNIAATLDKGSRAIVTGRLDQSTYTDRDGNERNKLEITVEACGPDLRFAQAEISRTDRVKAPVLNEEPF